MEGARGAYTGGSSDAVRTALSSWVDVIERPCIACTGIRVEIGSHGSAAATRADRRPHTATSMHLASGRNRMVLTVPPVPPVLPCATLVPPFLPPVPLYPLYPSLYHLRRSYRCRRTLRYRISDPRMRAYTRRSLDREEAKRSVLMFTWQLLGLRTGMCAGACSGGPTCKSEPRWCVRYPSACTNLLNSWLSRNGRLRTMTAPSIGTALVGLDGFERCFPRPTSPRQTDERAHMHQGVAPPSAPLSSRFASKNLRATDANSSIVGAAPSAMVRSAASGNVGDAGCTDFG